MANETEQYEKMIFLSKGAKEKVAQMNDQEIDILSMQIAHGLRKAYYEIYKEINDENSRMAHPNKACAKSE